MNIQLTRLTGGVLLAGMLLVNVQASAYSPENELLHIKGYSPEMIDVADTQRSRQEWREPKAPKRTPVEKFFHNIYYNEWTGNVDDFGSKVIRTNN